MLRLNKLTDYAVVLLCRMAAEQGTRFSTSQLTGLTSVPEPTVAKLLKDLAKSGMVEATRGATGGYCLTKAGSEATIRQVIEAIEGPIRMTECLDETSACCTTQKKCPLRGHWGPVNDAVIAALEGITLADMMPPQQTKQLVQIAH